MGMRIFVFATFVFWCGCSYALPGRWIAPDYAGREPNYPPKPLFWYTVDNSPIVYRTEISVDGPISAALFQVAVRGYCYVFVDNKLAFEWRPPARTQSEKRVLNVDLTGALNPGRHVLWVSAPGDGFAMTGKIWYVSGSVKELNTNGSWKAKKFPPSTVLELQPFVKLGAKLSDWVQVREVPSEGELQLSEEAVWREFQLREAERLDEAVSRCEWRLELLRHKGIAIEDWRAVGGWGGSYRIHPACRRLCDAGLKQTPALKERIAEFRRVQTEPMRRIGVLMDYAAGLRKEVRALEDLAETASILAILPDRVWALEAAIGIIGGPKKAAWLNQLASVKKALSSPENLTKAKLETLSANVKRVRKDMESAWGAPLNEPNESRFDKLGWIPINSLVESELGDWGIRVNPVAAPWHVNVPRSWRFKTDPGNQGLAEKRETVGYNIDDQWATIRTGDSWESQDITEPNPNYPSDSPYPNAPHGGALPYDGYAWYRTRVHVPEEWRGYDIELVADRAKDWDWAYFNGEQVGHTGPSVPDWEVMERRYKVPASLVRYGAENVIAWRIYNAGGEGFLGNVRLECPSLRRAAVGGLQADVLSTPLFPGTLIVPKSKTLELWGWRERGAEGPSEIFFMGKGGKLREVPLRSISNGASVFTAAQDRMTANWTIIVFEKERPILLVFQKHPSTISVMREEGSISRLKFTFDQPSARVVAIRLGTKAASGPEIANLVRSGAVRFWSQAALSIPIAYMELSRRDPKNPGRIHHVNVYKYASFKDDWGTKPIRLAPLPSLASRAIEKKFPGLQIHTAVRAVTPVLGGWAAYRVCEGTDRVSYSYPRDRIKRLYGFTSWMFAPSDSGVPGNDRECELIASTGSNSFRPQHNFSGERVRILADYCRKYGLTYTNNIDETLGGPWERVVNDYDAFMEDVTKHLVGIAELLKDRGPYEVAYDLINEPFHHPHEKYNPAMKKLTAAIRKVDKTHLLYIEPCESWGAVEKLDVVEPTGDPLTVYSFHDYNFRLRGRDRWPTLERDVTTMYRQFLPAFRFLVDHATVMHCGEFGGFEGTFRNPCTLTILNDFFRIFDQFGMHFHYYPNRDTVSARADGSLEESLVHEAYRRWKKMGHLGVFWP